MDTVEARRVLKERLAQYRLLPYADLVARIGNVEAVEIARGDGRPWELDFQFRWDGKSGGNVRVLGSIDDGGIRAFFPITDSFIKCPSEDLVGE